jgi:hypothetical protein
MVSKPYQIPHDYYDLIEAIAAENHHFYPFDLAASAAGQKILAAGRDEQLLFARAMLAWLENGGHRPAGSNGHTLHRLRKVARRESSTANPGRLCILNVRSAMLELLRLKLPLDQHDVVALLRWSGRQAYVHYCGAPHMIRMLEEYLAEQPLTPEIQAGVRQMLALLASSGAADGLRRWASRLAALGALPEKARAVI